MSDDLYGVSVIVPVFNAEKWLNECMGSLLSQNCNNYEIILVDDGSTDSSGAICDGYAKKEEIVKVIHQPNGGAGSARNAGLCNAHYRYIAFVDADDIVSPYYLKTMLSNTSGNIGGGTYLWTYSYTRNKCDFSLEGDCFVLLKDEAINSVLRGKDVNGYLWNKLFVRDVILSFDIRFSEEALVWEDMLFIIEYLQHIDGALYNNSKLYCYRNTPDSITNKKRKGDGVLKYRTLQKIEKLIGQESKENTAVLNQIFVKVLIPIINEKLHSGDKEKELLNVLKKKTKGMKIPIETRLKILYLSIKLL